MNKRIKRYLSLLLAIVMLLAYVPPVSAASREAQDAADALHDLGLFNGTGTDENGNPIYELDRAPTRAESVTMLVRLLGKENEATSGTWNTPFTDVADWAKPYVGYAYANGLTNGIGANTFGGSQTVTASQYLTFVLRALGYDSGTDFQWDKAWELSDKVGVTKGEYGASSAFTRGDVAIVSYRALSAKLKDGSRTLMDVVDSSIEHGTVYAVSSLDVSGKSVTATVNTINACTLKITFYDEDETKTVATASVRVPANREMEAFKTTASASLPKYFVAEAVLTDAGGKQLCDPYKTMKYTKKYEEFKAATVNDFGDDDIVMNFDEDIKTNFAVLNDGAVRVDCTDTVNACSADGNVLTFANANAQLDGIQEGTVLALYVDDVAMMSILVKNVSRSGNTVSVTADDDYEMQEMYQYIKVDVNETADEYYRTDDGGAVAYSGQSGSGVVFASAIYASPLNGGDMLYASLLDPIDVKSEDTLEGEVSYDLTDAVTLSAKVSATVNYSLKVSYDVRLFGKDYYEIEYKAELSGKIGGGVTAKKGADSTDWLDETFKLSPKDLRLELGKFYIPTPIPALSITADLWLPLKLDVKGEVSWEGQFRITSGFTCHQDANGKYQDNFESKSITTDTFKVSVEGSVSFGIHAAVGADFASVISAEVGAEAGIKVKIGMAKEFGSGLAFGKSEEKHYCAICLEGEAKLYFKADITFHLGFKIGKKLDIGIGNTWTIAEVEFLKRDFYYSVDLKLSGDPNYKGWGTKCPNRGYLVTVLAKDGDGKEIADLDVRILGSDKNGATDDKLKTGGSVYLRPGTYTAYVTASDGKEYTKAFTVATKAQEVEVEVKGEGFSIQTIIAPQYEAAQPFSDGYAAVKKDGKWGYIDENGKMVVQNKFDWAGVFNEGVAVAGIAGKAYDEWEEADIDVCYLYLVYPDGMSKQLKKPVYEWTYTEEDFERFMAEHPGGVTSYDWDEIMRLSVSDYVYTYVSAEYANEQVFHWFCQNGVVNAGDIAYRKDGTPIEIQNVQALGDGFSLYDVFETTGACVDGVIPMIALASYNSGPRWLFYMDINGNITRSFPTSNMVVDYDPDDDTLYAWYVYAPDENRIIYWYMDFDEEWNRVFSVGAMDLNGNRVIQPVYADFRYNYGGHFFSDDNLWTVKNQSGKWGAVDRNGKTIIPFEYDYLGMFREGMAGAIKNGKGYFIDTDNRAYEIQGLNGNTPSITALGSFDNGVAPVYDALSGRVYCVRKTPNEKNVLPLIEGTEKLSLYSYFPDFDGSEIGTSISSIGEIIVIEENGKFGYAKLTF